MDFSRVEAWHGEVRAFVEREKPGYDVLDIREDTTSKYEQVHEAGREPVWVVGRIEVRFSVRVASKDPFGHLIECKLALYADGRLHLYDESIYA